MNVLAVRAVPALDAAKRSHSARLEFTVDGRSVAEHVDDAGDALGAWLWDGWVMSAVLDKVAGLVAPLGSDFPDGSLAIHGCYCGSPDCGAISARVTRSNSAVRWTEVAYRDTTYFQLEPGERVVSFEFDAAAYDAVMGEVKALVERSTEVADDELLLRNRGPVEVFSLRVASEGQGWRA